MPFPFQRLPYEIQIHITRYALWTDTPIYISIPLPERRSGHRFGSSQLCSTSSLDAAKTSTTTTATSTDPTPSSLFPKPALAKLSRAFYDAAFNYAYTDLTFSFASRPSLLAFAHDIGPAHATLISSIALPLAPLRPRIYPGLTAAFPNLLRADFVIPACLRSKRAEIRRELEALCARAARLRHVGLERCALSGRAAEGWVRVMIEDCNLWLERRDRRRRRSGGQSASASEGGVEDDWGPCWRDVTEEMEEDEEAEEDERELEVLVDAPKEADVLEIATSDIDDETASDSALDVVADESLAVEDLVKVSGKHPEATGLYACAAGPGVSATGSHSQ